MSCGAGNENCSEVVREFDHSEVGNQRSNSGEEQNRNLQPIAHNDSGNPPRKGFGIDVETTGVINPSGDKNVYEEPILVITPEWQRQSWLLEVSQSVEDNPESVMSVNSEHESDGGDWTFEDGPDARLMSYELQIRNMTSISEALKERARKAEKEQSDKENAFKKQLDEIHYNHAESLQAQQDQYDAELTGLLNFKKGLVRDYERLTVKYRTACAQVKDQNKKINDLEAKISGYTEVLDHVKAPDGSIYTHKQRQGIVEDLKRDANSQKEFYENQIKTLGHQMARKVTRLNKAVEECFDLRDKLETRSTELANEQQKFREVETKLEMERKTHADTEEISMRDFQVGIQEAQATIEHRENQIQHMDFIIRSLQAHVLAAQQSYGAAMGTAQNLHRAHEKSSEENRELVEQHRQNMERISKDHKSVCDSHSKNEAVLQGEIASLRERLRLVGDNCTYDWSQWKVTANAMQQEILDLRAASYTLTRDKNVVNAELPGKTGNKEIGNWQAEALDALETAQAQAYMRSLDKGKGVADDIAENRSREAVKNLAELPGSEFLKLQAVHSGQITQPSKSRPTTVIVQSELPSQPTKPKPTPKAGQRVQPSKSKPASAPTHTEGLPPNLPAIPGIANPAKAQSENQLNVTTAVAPRPTSSRSFSIHCEPSYLMKPRGAHVKTFDEVQMSSADIERSRPILIPIATEKIADHAGVPGSPA